MTTLGFSKLPQESQMDHMKRTSTLIHRIVKGNMIVSLYWSKEFIYEVLNPKNNMSKYEIKCFDRYKYVQS